MKKLYILTIEVYGLEKLKLLGASTIGNVIRSLTVWVASTVGNVIRSLTI